jgi:hypothetical protein
MHELGHGCTSGSHAQGWLVYIDKFPELSFGTNCRSVYCYGYRIRGETRARQFLWSPNYSPCSRLFDCDHVDAEL